MNSLLRIVLVSLVMVFCTVIKGQTPAEIKERFDAAETYDEKAQMVFTWASRLRKRNPQRALNILDRVKDHHSKIEQKAILSEILILRGDILNEQNKTELAKRSYTTAFQIAARNSIADAAMKSLQALEKNALATENYRQAYTYSEQAVDFLLKVKNIKSTPTEIKLPREANGSKYEETIAGFKKKESQWIADQQDLKQRYTIAKTRNAYLLDSLKRVEEQMKIQQMLLSGQISETEAKRLEKNADRAMQKARSASRKTEELQKELASTSAELMDAETKQEQQELLLYLAAAIGFFILSLALLFYGRYRSKKKASKALQEKNEIIEEERARSEELLLNILPANIAQELKESGKAKTKKYNNATVLFTDFKNFSSHAERMKPEELVEELDKAFKSFDYIISQYNIEKIKTIGDAYMCASGLGSDSTRAAYEMVQAALDMQEYLDDIKKEKISRGQNYFEARIGIHTGPVIAGVVGIKKFAFDIWGDTVNIASRVEQKGEPGKVNISEATYSLVKGNFLCKHRGKVSIKNKGMLDMYFVEHA